MFSDAADELLDNDDDSDNDDVYEVSGRVRWL
jgi:hypothetical protein